MSEESKKMIQYLEAAKSALRQQQKAAGEVKRQEELVAKMEKKLEREQEAVEESIGLSIKTRRQEIEGHYDQQSGVLQNAMKRTRGKRDRAKNRKMKSRMKDETSQVRQKNSMLKNEIRTLFQKDKVPLFCNTWVFYALYYPRKIQEILFFLLCLALALGLIPCGIYFLFLSGRSALHLALVYIVDILIFGGLYILVNNRTKVRHHAALKEGRRIRDSIATNEKQIRAIVSGIRKDTDETMYGLEEFDDKLARLEQDNADVLRGKKEALDEFDGETAETIRREILSNNEERLKQMEEDLRKAENRLEKLQGEERFWARKLGERFGGEPGAEFMTEEKLDLLIRAFKDGAANMMEAQEMVRRGQSGKQSPANITSQTQATDRSSDQVSESNMF